MIYKEFISAFAALITVFAFYRYFQGILNNTIKPHIFSWFIWAVTTLIVFFAQHTAGAGIGAWPIGLSGLITAAIAILAYRQRIKLNIRSTDWLFLTAALASLPLWIVTADPTWAVIILTITDLLGFGPTLRQAYHYPHSESLLFFSLFAVRNVLVVLALENYSLTTALFPAAISLACTCLIVLILARRKMLLS